MQDLTGKLIIITSGPTFAPIDAVRSITNRSTGRLGCAIAHALMDRGAEVFFLAGETSLTPSMLHLDQSPDRIHDRIHESRFTTVEQLRNSLQNILRQNPIHAVLMAAAVLDYIPICTEEGKKRSNEDEWIIRLKRGEKIIERILEWSPDVYLVGFKLEARISLDDLTQRAGDLMRRSGAKLVVANRVEEIEGTQHVAYLVENAPDEGGRTYRVSPPLLTRESIGEALANHLSHVFTTC